MGKRRAADDGGGDYIAPKGLGPSGAGQMAMAGRGGEPRRGSLELDEVPRPKKTKPQNLQKLSLEDLNQRKHDLKMEENYHSNVMGIKKRGPYSASDVRASYTQVLRFQYLQKEVDLEIERREARKESQAEAKARKRQEKEDVHRAAKAAMAAAQEEAFAGGPAAAAPSTNSFVSFEDMGRSWSASAPYGRPMEERSESGANNFQMGTSNTAGGMGGGFYGASAGSDGSDAAPMNPMMAMAQMMLETQKKLKEAQEKMNKVSEVTGTGSSSTGSFPMGGGCGGCGGSCGCGGCGGCCGGCGGCGGCGACGGCGCGGCGCGMGGLGCAGYPPPSDAHRGGAF